MRRHLNLRVTKVEMTGKLLASSSLAAPAFAQVAVASRPEDIAGEWISLAREAAISPYQTYPFLSAWADTVGRCEGATPFIVHARDAAGKLQAIVPLCLERRAGIEIALFLGGRESNFNIPILAAGTNADPAVMRQLLIEAAHKAHRKPDIFYFRNQPKSFDGANNPFVCETARPSAGMAYGATLPERQEELTSRLSGDARKKLRKKAARLEAMGPLIYEHDAHGEAATRILDALIEQKSERFAETGVRAGFDIGGVRALLRRLQAEGDGALELHALKAGDRIVATYAGIVRDKRFSAMLNSYDMSEDVARSSPGELLLHALMRNLVSRGFTHFDLGAGEARYKKAVCEDAIQLFDTILPVTPRGKIAAPFFASFLTLKRRVKKSERLTRLYYSARRAIG